MPNNFRHMDSSNVYRTQNNCAAPPSVSFSCFKQLFAEGQEFSYHLEDLGHYYRDYVGLMDFGIGVF